MRTTTRATTAANRATNREDAVRKRIDRRCRELGERRASSYRRVILALYMTADADGVLNVETNLEIGIAAGFKTGNIGDYLKMAEADGIIRTFRKGLICRVMVLLDKPKAKTYVKTLAYQSGERGRFPKSRA